MNFNEYQEQVHTTAIYPVDENYPWMYPALGLCNEAGELIGKLKKIMRDNSGEITPQKREELKAEAGDVGWYWAELMTMLDISLSDVVESNVAKLKSRQQRGVLGGSGDNR